MKFAAPYFLLAFIPIVCVAAALWWKLTRAKQKPYPRVNVPYKKLWRHRGPMALSPRVIHLMGYVIAASFFVIALARPQSSFQKIKRSVEGIDIMLVFDLSASMRIEDFRDANRFEVAKQVLGEFIESRSSDKIGLLVFSGEAVTVVPPTLDYQLLKQSLKETQIGDLKDGTAIGDALSTAVSRLKESRAKSRVIILVTDGDSNIGQVDPLTAGELAKGYGIKVYSIAIGRDGRVAMPFVSKDIFGRQIKTYQYFDSSINPELLKQISKETGGKFYRVEDDIKTFRGVFEEINKLEKNTIETSEQVKYEEHFETPLQIGLIILLLTFLIQNTWMRVYP